MTRPHLALLDGLRGYAAFGVLLYHLRHFWGDMLPVANGYLAVDLFFMMSGVVIAMNYGERLRDGSLSRVDFLRRRFLRLYPVYMVGGVLGLAVLAVLTLIGEDWSTPVTLASGLLWHLLMLPEPLFRGDAGPFPLDPPAWSLFFEIWGNVIYALIVVRLSPRGVGVLTALALAGYVAASQIAGTVELGVAYPTLFAGLFRFWFGFGTGLLIWRMRERLPDMGRAGWPVVVLAMLFPGLPNSDLWRFFWIVLVLPLGVIAAMRLPAPADLCRALGQMSYPLYILHWPLMMLAVKLAVLVEGPGAWSDPRVGAAVVVLTLIVTGWVTFRLEPRLRAGFAALLSPSR
ncbi:acyltransferase family protein [Paenirhodobacter enshiensis]|uniref:acyltransferase family protein n=1 Tax=Paenirhodobacter enshiensis TaxID=1105367 RepID=UPI003FA256BA